MQLSEYVDDVQACSSKEALDKLLISTLSEIGATAISGYAFPYGGDVSTNRTPIISTWPERIRTAYRKRMAGDDPIMYATMTLGMPVHYLKLAPTLDFNPVAEAVLDTMRSFGFKDAVATPVYAKPGAYAYFVAAFPEERPDLTPADLRRIMFVFSEYFYRYREMKHVRRSALSPRERQVLVAIVHDKSNAEIAEMLGVSQHTVGTYVRRCFEKLDVNSRTQAVLCYLGGGAVELPSA